MHGNHVADFTESGDETRYQDLMRVFVPEVDPID